MVDFRALEYLGSDLTKLLPNQVELIIFRITPFEKRNKQEFWCTKMQFLELGKSGALQTLMGETYVTSRSNYKNSLTPQTIQPDGMLERIASFLTKQNQIKAKKCEIEARKKKINDKLEELQEAKQDPIVALRKQIARRKEELMIKRRRVENLASDLNEIRDNFEHKRKREFDAHANMFQAYEQKLGKDI